MALVGMSWLMVASLPAPGGAEGHVGVRFRVGAVGEARVGRFRVVRIEGAAGKGKVDRAATRAMAVVEADASVGAGGRSAALTELPALATAWSAAHPPGRFEVRRRGGRVEIVSSGPNPLGGLTAFLSTLDLRIDRWGALAAFVGIAVGLETDGASLGIAARDPATRAPLTVTLLSCQEAAGAPEARLDVHLPPHLPPSRLEAPLRDRTAAFTRRTSIPIDLTLSP
jgi:hypothetical protein